MTAEQSRKNGQEMAAAGARSGKQPEAPFSGLFLVDKAAGPTSFDVVAKARRVFSCRKIGHCGTLDPFATGLLVLAVGKATAVIRYMEGYDKRYAVRCRVGRATDSQDVSGETVEVITPDRDIYDAYCRGAEPRGRLAEALDSLTGRQTQIPPAFSAVKVGGRPLYYYAHRGLAPPEIAAREVAVHKVELLETGWDPVGDPLAPLYLDLRIDCGKGTYVRTLCAELGRRLDYAAYAETLRRETVGPFSVNDACPYTLLQEAAAGNATLTRRLRADLLPPDRALAGFPVVKFTENEIDALLCGRHLGAKDGVLPGDRFLIRENTGNAGVPEDSRTWGVGIIRMDESGRPCVAAERMFYNREDYQKRRL